MQARARARSEVQVQVLLREKRTGELARATERDFGRVLDRLAVDQEFENRVLADPDRALAPFDLDEDELMVLREYRRWRIVR